MKRKAVRWSIGPSTSSLDGAKRNPGERIADSPSVDEIKHQKAFYFEKGAREFWLCNRTGTVEYFDLRGQGGQV